MQELVSYNPVHFVLELDKSEITAVAILLSASGDQRVDDPGLDAGAAVPDGLRGAE